MKKFNSTFVDVAENRHDLTCPFFLLRDSVTEQSRSEKFL